ncbi:unnamed protein product [Closterium sp. Yama58-4]|nr:unnamed protein product [Closterium sp. Yama58-4]
MAAIHASAAARLATSSPSAIFAASSRSENGSLSRSAFFSGSSRSLVLSAESPVSAARPASTSSQPASLGLAPCNARRLSVSAQAAGSDAAKVGPVAVVGGTGFVGSALVKALLAEGEQVKVLTRSVDRAKEVFAGTEGVELVGPEGWAAAIAGSGSVVNLAGTPISTRWSPAIKAEIISSRVDTTAKIVEAINSLPKDKRPSVLVNTSAVGFYGTSETATFDESSPAGNDFLAEVCTKWEAEARKVSPESTRLAIIRFGVVLDKGGGALGKMLPIFQLFAGGPLGTGQQWMSWVHRDDLVALIIETLRNTEFQGVLNGTAPSPARMAQFCEALGSAIGRPSWLPVPNFAVQTLLGEGAMVVLDGQRVLPKRTESLGFRFKYRNIQNALAAILSSS